MLRYLATAAERVTEREVRAAVEMSCGAFAWRRIPIMSQGIMI